MACMTCALLKGISTFLNVDTILSFESQKTTKLLSRTNLKHMFTCHDTTLGQSSPSPFQKSSLMLHLHVHTRSWESIVVVMQNSHVKEVNIYVQILFPVITCIIASFYLFNIDKLHRDTLVEVILLRVPCWKVDINAPIPCYGKRELSLTINNTERKR